MKVLVCGSREWDDYNAIHSALSALPGEHEEITVIHGDARGADRLAAKAAEDLGFHVEAFPADWDRFGLSAGIRRNLVMLDEGPSKVFAFRMAASRGTTHTIEAARKRGIPVEVIER